MFCWLQLCNWALSLPDMSFFIQQPCDMMDLGMLTTFSNIYFFFFFYPLWENMSTVPFIAEPLFTSAYLHLVVSTSRLCQEPSEREANRACRSFHMHRNPTKLEMHPPIRTGERNIHEKLVSLIPPPKSVHVQSSIPWAPCLHVWSCQLRTALSDRSPDVSFGFGFSTGKRPGPQREVRKREKKKNKPQIPGAWREKTDCLSEAYQSMECYMHSQASEDWY